MVRRVATTNPNIRPVAEADYLQILELYRAVARQGDGIARTAPEITEAYVRNNLQNALTIGIGLVAVVEGRIAAEIHTSPPAPLAFRHVLSDLTIAVHPDFQGQGLGRRLFQALLDDIQTRRPHILRVELITRESNRRAIALYEQLGFRVEGRMERRIAGSGGLEADIPMAWFNPNYVGFV